MFDKAKYDASVEAIKSQVLALGEITKPARTRINEVSARDRYLSFLDPVKDAAIIDALKAKGGDVPEGDDTRAEARALYRALHRVLKGRGVME